MLAIFRSSSTKNSSQCWIFGFVKIRHYEEFSKNFWNPGLWGISKKRSYSSQCRIFKIFEATDDIFEIFDIDVNDDFDQARLKFLTMNFFPKRGFFTTIPHIAAFFKFQFFLTKMDFTGWILRYFNGVIIQKRSIVLRQIAVL